MSSLPEMLGHEGANASAKLLMLHSTRPNAAPSSWMSYQNPTLPMQRLTTPSIPDNSCGHVHTFCQHPCCMQAKQRATSLMRE